MSFALVACVMLSSRVAPGTVAEQRARLPPPAECGDDPIEGIWRSHQHFPRDREWTEFTLEIRRKKGSKTALTGTIKNHSWLGGSDREQPGKCDATTPWRLIVGMPAKGELLKDDRVKFEGTSWKIEQIVCGTTPPFWGYNLDVFTGKVDLKREEFQSVNNDGGRMVNHPTVFRRIKCFDGTEAPSRHIEVKPPPFFPESNSGCGCGMVGG